MFDNLQPFDQYKPIAGVYAIVCKALQRCYIGESKHIHARFASHAKDLATGKHPSARLQKDHDEGNEITYTILAEVGNKKARLKKEQELIQHALLNGFDVYNAAINGETNKAETQARRRRRLLQGNIGAGAEKNGKRAAGIRSHAENVGHVSGSGRKTRGQQGAGLEGGQSKLLQSEAAAGAGQGVRGGGEAKAKRPKTASVDENGQSGKGGGNSFGILSVSFGDKLGIEEYRRYEFLRDGESWLIERDELLRLFRCAYDNDELAQLASDIQDLINRPLQIWFDQGNGKEQFERLVEKSGGDQALLLAALDALEATALADSRAASQSPESVPPYPRRQSSCLPLR